MAFRCQTFEGVILSLGYGPTLLGIIATLLSLVLKGNDGVG